MLSVRLSFLDSNIRDEIKYTCSLSDGSQHEE